MECDLQELGRYDVALFLGVLYHMREPFRALERLHSVTKELAVIETAAIECESLGDRPLLEFIEGGEINGDDSNWFLPTEAAVSAMCRAAGFRMVETVDRDFRSAREPDLVDYRLTLHART
jgi:tRNA (mo5U34)-methyltransferase